MPKYLNHFPQPFLEDLVNGKCIPIIGAGFSRNAKTPPGTQMPLWDDLGRAIASKMGKDYHYASPLDAISAFSHAFERVKLIELLNGLLLIERAKPGTAHKTFCQTPFDIVITTNAEFLLERGYESVQRYCRPVMDEDQLPIMQCAGVILLKIHGDLHHPNRLIITEEDYDTFLERYPLISTFLGNLLISRTPLFIGYSLDDPDFRHIWQLIGTRLGRLRRPAYTISVGATEVHIERFERRGVKMINLPGEPSDYPKIFEDVFCELREYWSDNLAIASTVTEEEALAEISLPRGARTRLCFFLIPLKVFPFYKSAVFPIAEKYGFAPVTTEEMVSPAENVFAKIYSIMERTEVVVADFTTTSFDTSYIVLFPAPAVRFEKPHVLIIGEEKIAHEVFSHLPISRATFISPINIDESSLLKKIDNWFKRISKGLRTVFEQEPQRLLEIGEYRAAIISAITLLESNFRRLLQEEASVVSRFESRPHYLSKMIDAAARRDFINSNQIPQLKEWLVIRNKLVHTSEPASKELARQVVEGVMKILKNLPPL